MASPISPSAYATPQVQRGNYYVENMEPSQSRRLDRAYQAALAMQASDDRKLAIFGQIYKNAEDRVKALTEIKAEYIKDKSRANTQADRDAADARYKERMDRYKATNSALEGNADRATQMSTARIRASGEAAAALGRAKREELGIQVERLDSAIRNEMGTGQRDLTNNLIIENIDSHLDQIKRDEPSALPGLRLGAKNLVEHSKASGTEFPYEATAKNIADLGDSYQRNSAADVVMSSLETPEQRERFRRAYDTYNQYKNPSEFKGDGDVSAAIAGGQAGYVDPNRAGNMSLPEAQSDEDFGKSNIGGYYQGAIDQADAAIADARGTRDRVLSVLLGYEQPNLIDRTRDIFWQKYRGGRRPNIPEDKSVRVSPLIENPYEVYGNEDTKITLPEKEPVKSSGGVRRTPPTTEDYIAPPETSPAQPPTVPNPYLYWQGPPMPEQANEEAYDSPARMPRDPDPRDKILELLQGNTGVDAARRNANQIMDKRVPTYQPPLHRAPPVNPIDVMRRTQDASSRAALENNAEVQFNKDMENATPVERYQMRNKIPPYDRGIPPVDEQPPSKELQAPQRVFPPGSKLRESPLTGGVEKVGKTATTRDRMFTMAQEFLDKSDKFSRLQSNDPVVRAAANTYAINRRNNVPFKSTLESLNQRYAGDEESKIKAAATVVALMKRDKTGLKLDEKVG